MPVAPPLGWARELDPCRGAGSRGLLACKRPEVLCCAVSAGQCAPSSASPPRARHTHARHAHAHHRRHASQRARARAQLSGARLPGPARHPAVGTLRILTVALPPPVTLPQNTAIPATGWARARAFPTPHPPRGRGGACCEPRPGPAPAYLGQVQLPARAPGADDEVLGEQEALPLALFLQGQRPQPPPGDLALLGHGHLDEGACGRTGRDPEWPVSRANLHL